MNSRHRFGILLAAAVVLASCYETATPLINGIIAQWPLGDGITYTKRDSAGTLAPVSGRLWRDGDTYLLQDDGSLEAPGRIRFHALRDNFYVAQRDNGGRYNYDLVRVEADAVYAYGLRCDAAEDAVFIASGVMTASTDVDLTCTPNSLDTLQGVLDAKSSSTPRTVYARTGTVTGPAPIGAVKPGAEAPIAFGQTLQGEIGPGDAIRDGKHVDAYRFTGAAGQRITIDMPGEVLDTYLLLFSANDTANPLSSDDDSAGNLDARINYTLPQSGDYIIHATSAFEGGSGEYSLTLNGAPAAVGKPTAPGAAAGGGNVVDGIDFGADTSSWANDGECDDPRFQGPGVASVLVDADLRADATDCLAMYRAGRAALR